MEHDVYVSADFADLSSLTHFDVNTEELLTARVNTLSLAARPSSPPGNEIMGMRKGEEGLAEPARFLVT